MTVRVTLTGNREDQVVVTNMQPHVITRRDPARGIAVTAGAVGDHDVYARTASEV